MGGRRHTVTPTRSLSAVNCCCQSACLAVSSPAPSLTGADVVPVLVVGAHLLVGSGLNQVAPRGQLDATGVLEVLGVSLDEVSRGDIAHGDPSGLVVRHGAWLRTRRVDREGEERACEFRVTLFNTQQQSKRCAVPRAREEGFAACTKNRTRFSLRTPFFLAERASHR